MSERISKLEGARRQLDVAIDLYFLAADSLAIHTLAWAAFKVLFDLYPHRNSDGFEKGINELVQQVGWKQFAHVANFLKHADRDPEAFLQSHSSGETYGLIGFASLLYRRMTGEMSVKTQGWDMWVEWIAADELGIPDPDENAGRVAHEAELRRRVKALPYEQQVKVGRHKYHHFLENYERVSARVEEAMANGMTLQQLLDEVHAKAKG